ncbi:MAG: class I SAM-dependent rRNA methyltransferase [Verrucomicrobia bacterium]|nr:class I SAM-dependent rRNA methyltransferase [Verrucomicrobiota bacterium]
MESLPTVLLKPGEADRVLAGHPWIYEGAVMRLTKPPADGDVVQVKDHRQRFLGTGFFNSKSKIRVRVISGERQSIDASFFRQRIEAAMAVRRRHMPEATSYRVVNSESDHLSGLIVDKYEDVLVLQTSSLGMDRRKGQIVDTLKHLFHPRAILERNDMGSRKFEGMEECGGTLFGEELETVEVRLNGLRFTLNLKSGHKTGLYLDQQANYQAVARFAKGGRVLDCFSFLGGFGIHAARAGATQALGVDQSEDATAAARSNAKANGLGDRCVFEAANVFDWFKVRAAQRGDAAAKPEWDLIVLDPPSFTRNRASVGDALRGYKEIHLRALKMLKPGGVLATFCCSHHVNAELFMDVILAAAYDARKQLRRVAVYTQSPDHPVLPAIAETEYLKGFAFELV